MRNHLMPGRALGFAGCFLSCFLGLGLLSIGGCQGTTTGNDPNFRPGLVGLEGQELRRVE